MKRKTEAVRLAELKAEQERRALKIEWHSGPAKTRPLDHDAGDPGLRLRGLGVAPRQEFGTADFYAGKIEFRRTERDRQPPRSVMTGRFFPKPFPGRAGPGAPAEELKAWNAWVESLDPVRKAVLFRLMGAPVGAEEFEKMVHRYQNLQSRQPLAA